MADSAGDKVSALNAEMTTEMAIVTANCCVEPALDAADEGRSG